MLDVGKKMIMGPRKSSLRPRFPLQADPFQPRLQTIENYEKKVGTHVDYPLDCDFPLAWVPSSDVLLYVTDVPTWRSDEETRVSWARLKSH